MSAPSIPETLPSPEDVVRAIQAARSEECRHPACNKEVEGMIIWVMSGRTAVERAGVVIDERCTAASHTLRDSAVSVGKLLLERCRDAFNANDSSGSVERWFDLRSEASKQR